MKIIVDSQETVNVIGRLCDATLRLNGIQGYGDAKVVLDNMILVVPDVPKQDQAKEGAKE